MNSYDYIREGDAIYEKSFAIIREEADLSPFSSEQAEIAVRMIHACGLVEAAQHFRFSRDSWPMRAARCMPANRSIATPKWWPMA